MSEWISVEDKLPTPYRSVELFRPEAGAGEDQIWRGFYSPSVGFKSSEYESPLDGVTHWMPLPEPPRNEEEAMSLFELSQERKV